MASPLPPFIFLRLLFLLATFHFVVNNTSSSVQPRCHDNESSALIQFKKSFSIKESASDYPSAYPKVAPWKLLQGEGSNTSCSDCCSWDGITCHGDTGHVIGLDLSSSFLYGSINSTSTLFHLVHLRRLNLADNNFNLSQIPYAVGLLSRLTYLNLSLSVFDGQIPLEISQLNKLVTLDLSKNYYFSGSIPASIGNLSQLVSLDLSKNYFSGSIPTSIGNLSQLVSLDLSLNPLLKLQKPGLASLVQNLTDLKLLHLSTVNISSVVPEILTNFSSLRSLNLEYCGLHGEFPASIGNLSQLVSLDLSDNYFSGSIPASIGNLAHIVSLDLSKNNLSGSIPTSIGNLGQLVSVNLYDNSFSGPIPSWIGNLTQLISLDLASNLLQGPIPDSISRLVNLELLGVGFNSLSGPVKLEMFLTLKNLAELQLSYNPLTLLTNTSYTNAPLPKFVLLQLASCNLTEFPDFLRFQDNLQYLDLGNNRIQGLVPKWIWNMSIETLGALYLHENFLNGFELPPPVFRWSVLRLLVLSSNMLHGSLPIPPSSTHLYDVSNNKLTGDIPPLICNLSALYSLDLSYNNLSGVIPQCLGSFSNSLSELNLQSNNLRGQIPQTFNNESGLQMIALSQNQLQGPVPRSLFNCKRLEILDLENNQINSTFPFWLGTDLPELKVLILRYNRFHGTIWKHPESSSAAFPKLLVIDLSHNSFSGKLPSDYFHNWKALKTIDDSGSIYMHTNTELHLLGYRCYDSYNYSMTIKYRGVEATFSNILDIFTFIDLSSNQFDGEISETIGILKGLLMLNLSNNNLIGHIPSSLGNLTKLESLDLSQNKLSGEISQQLTQLTFLAIFNVSHNHFKGPIPRGWQFGTFLNNSYQENSGLCGEPLSKKCGNSEAPPPTSIFGSRNYFSCSN